MKDYFQNSITNFILLVLIVVPVSSFALTVDISGSSTTNNVTTTSHTINIPETIISGVVAVTYDLEYRLNSNGAWSTVSGSNHQSVYNVTLSSEATYEYRWEMTSCAQTPFGVSCNSSTYGPVHTLRYTKQPSVPASVSRTPSTSTNGTVSVSWPASTNATKYTLQQQFNGGSWVTKQDTSTRSKTFTGLAKGTYRYRVRACRVGAFTACSSYRYASNNYVPPAVPSSITISPINSAAGSQTVSWSSSSQATKYTLQRQINDGSWATMQDSSARSDSFSGLVSGKYEYQVRACANTVCSTYKTSAASYVARAPGAITTSGATTNDIDGSYTLNWTASSGTVESYQLQRRTAAYGSSSYGGWSTIQNTSSRTKAESSLASGNYQYRVRSKKGTAYSSWTATKTVSVLRIPGTPSSLTVPNWSADGNLAISWGTASGVVSSYELYRRTAAYNAGNTGTWTAFSLYKTQTARSLAESSLPDNFYDYRVRACNANGCSDYREQSATTVLHAPSTPTAVTVNPTLSDGRFVLSWNDVPEFVEYYEIEQQRSTTLGASWEAWADDSKSPWSINAYGSGAQAVSLEKPTHSTGENTHYRYQVKSCNDSGCSDFSTVVEVVVEPPGTPETLLIETMDVGADAVLLGAGAYVDYDFDGDYDLYWTSVAGNDPAIEYRIEKFVDGVAFNGAGYEFSTSDINSLNYAETGLLDGKTYSYVVEACIMLTGSSTYHCGDPSYSYDVIVALPPSDVTGLSLSPGTGSAVDLSWTAPSTGTVTGYLIEYRHKDSAAGTWSDWDRLADAVDDGLNQPDITNTYYSSSNLFGDGIGIYEFRVAGCNQSILNCGGSSEFLVEPPSAPQQPVLSYTGTGTDYQLDWSVPLSGTTTLYVVQWRLNDTGTWTTKAELPATAGTSYTSSTLIGTQPGTHELRVIACNLSINVCSQPSITVGKVIFDIPEFDAPTNPSNTNLTGDVYYGSLNGTHNVGQDGSFNYRVPIEVVPGINGMQPNISLSYNSNRRNGAVGWGWAIGGLSAITRCPASLVRDAEVSGINTGDNYEFCLDGQRLIEIYDSGTGYGEYRTESETFSRIYRFSGTAEAPSYWTVETKDGSTLWYGAQGGYGTLTKVDDGSGNAMAWYLGYKGDIATNSMKYNYEITASGMHRIESIEYGNGGHGYKNSVEFTYEARDDELLRYSAGSAVVTDERLSQILVKANGAVVREYSLNYQIQGQAYNGQINDDSLGLSKLDSISLCHGVQTNCADDLVFDWDNTSVELVPVDQTVSEAQYEKIVGFPFDSTANQSFNTWYAGVVRPFGFWSTLPELSGSGSTGITGHFDKNLERDFVVPGTLVLNNDTHFAVPSGLFSTYPPSGTSECDTQTFYRSNGTSSSTSCANLWIDYVNIDLNGDSIEDILVFPVFRQFGLKAYIGTGSGFQVSPNAGNNASGYSFSASSNALARNVKYKQSPSSDTLERYVHYKTKIIDVNGDGLVDILRLAPFRAERSSYIGSVNESVEVALNTGSGFAPFEEWLDIDQLPDLLSHVEFGDVTGDGLVDIVAASGAVAVNTGSSFAPNTSWRIHGVDYGRAVGFSGTSSALWLIKQPRIIDVNGDGLDDYVYIQTYAEPYRADYEGPGTTTPFSNSYGCLQDCLNIFVEVALSNGNGFEPLVEVLEYEYPANSNTIYFDYYPEFRDMNGDGALDIIWMDDNMVTSTRDPSLSYQDTLFTKEWKLPQEAYTVAYADLKGGFLTPEALFTEPCWGGVADSSYLAYLQHHSQGAANCVPSPDYVVNDYQPRISNVQADISIAVNYQPFNLSDPNGNYIPVAEQKNIYTHPVGASLSAEVFSSYKMSASYDPEMGSSSQLSSEPRRNLRRYGVGGIEVEFDGNTMSENYHYYDALYDRGGYGSLGFSKIDKTVSYSNQNQSIKTVTEHHQNVDGDDADHDFRLVGQIKRQVTCVVDSADEDCVESGNDFNLLSDARNRWKVRIYDDDADAGFDSPHFFPFVLQSSVSSWDLNGTKVSDSRTQMNDASVTSLICSSVTSSQYNAVVTTTSLTANYSEYGVPLYSRTVICDESGTSLDVTASSVRNLNITNQISADGWVVGLVGRTDIRSYASDSLANLAATDQMRRTHYVYYTSDDGDNKAGMLKTETIEQNDALLKLANEFSYNTYGSVSSIKESWTHDGVAQSRTTGISETFGSTGERTIAVTNPLNQTETTIYDAKFGQPRKITDINNLNTTTSYDVAGRIDTITYADDTTTSSDYRTCSGTCFADSSYEAWYLQTKTTGSKDIRTYFDGLDRELGSRTFGLTGTQTFISQGYDAQGNIAYTYDPYYSSTAVANRARTGFDYDLLGRATRVDYADGSYSTTAYNGLTLTFTNQAGQSQTRLNNGAGWVMNSTDNAGTPVDFTYTPWGDLDTTQVNGATGIDTKVDIDYDNLGRKIKLDDPNTGVIDYAYDPLGRLDYEINARGQKTEYDYDLLDRQITRIDDADSDNPAERTSTWVYDSAVGKGIGQLESATGKNTDGSDFSESYTYDSLGRAIGVETDIDGQTFVSETFYDSYSRVAGTMYPTGYSTRNLYNSYGHMQAIENAEQGNHDNLWHANAADARGNITQFTLGNNVITDQTFDPDFGRIDTIRAYKGGFEIQDQEYEFSSLGNLIWRKDTRSDTTGSRNLTEHFCYDNMNRLTAQGFDSDCGSIDDYTYDVYGNIKTRTGVSGTYGYGSNAGPNAVTSADGNTYGYDATGNLISSSDGTSVQYTSYNKPTTISKEGNSSTVVYGPMQSRVKRSDSNGRSTIYAGLSNYEETTDSVTGITEQIHYLGGFGSYIVQIGAAYDDYYLYQHTDHIGSIVAKSDGTASSESNIEWLANDPWGERLVETWDGVLESDDYIPLGTSRGFTDHEHLDGVGLIHMNGRVYDPTLGRFMSPDPFVQAPYNTQSYNRYSYVFNNPLSFTDPTGYQSDCEVANNCRFQDLPSDSTTTGQAGNSSIWTFILPGDPGIFLPDNVAERQENTAELRGDLDSAFVGGRDFLQPRSNEELAIIAGASTDLVTAGPGATTEKIARGTVQAANALSKKGTESKKWIDKIKEVIAKLKLGGNNSSKFKIEDFLGADAMSDKQFRKLVKDIAQNGLKNKEIEFVIKDGVPHVTHGSNRLAAAKYLQITDQLTFVEKTVPTRGFQTLDDVTRVPPPKLRAPVTIQSN